MTAKLKIIVFGPTGGTGRAVVEQALESGHKVTAFSRSPFVPRGKSDGLTVLRGDAFDDAAVSNAVKGHDAVVSSLGTRPWKHSNVCSEGTKWILQAMNKQGVKRFVVVSALGVGPTRESLAWFLKPFYQTVIRRALRDKETMEADIKRSDRDWVIVQPPILTNGRSMGNYRVATDGSIHHGFISRADVAHFILRDCVQGSRYVRQSPVLAY
ncbi:MAG: SDR family oxidoreductase [Nitrospirae bacterium]|nr:SDR family oxidoreductase [Nitrospirota bacterium]